MIEYRDDVTKKTKQEIRSLEEKLGNGAVKDWAEYRGMVGMIKGLKKSLGISLEAYKRHFDIDDDDDDEGEMEGMLDD